MTWRQGALILGTYSALAAALTAVALALGSSPSPPASDPRPGVETRASVEIPPSPAARPPAATTPVIPGTRGPGRDDAGESLPAAPRAPARADAAGGASVTPRRSAVRRGDAARPAAPSAGTDTGPAGPTPDGPTPDPVAPSTPTPSGGTPPAVAPAPVPVSAPAPGGTTTTLRSVQGVGRTGETQSVVLDFDVDGTDGATRSVDVPITVTPPAGAVALRIDVDLSPTDTAGEDARIEVAPVAVAPASPTVEGHADGSHSIVVALPLNGVLAPVPGGAADFSEPATTSEVPVVPGPPARRDQD